MDHAQQLPAPFPWRAATVVAGGVALLELVALIAIGLMHFAPKTTAAPAAPAVHRHAVVHRTHVVAPRTHAIRQVALRPVSKVRVLVLNGNGVNGAAAAQAARLQAEGYPVAGAVDAQRHDYAQSMVLFVPGWAKEARRLAHASGVGLVAPVDGMRGAQLRGAKVILLLGR